LFGHFEVTLSSAQARDTEDVEAEAEPYRVLLIYLDPSKCDTPIFEKVCVR
ncbi:MAG: hypothetical protein QOD39_1393, partial [Mycobacterium sp.]|nr:hypothetical protein [Mycobacterium sp.]